MGDMKKIGWFGQDGWRRHKLPDCGRASIRYELCPFARFLGQVSCYSANCDLMRSETHKKPQLIVDNPVAAA
jgi:hypothetical protein